MNDQPENTEWVLVKHTRFPIPGDEEIGRYPTAADAMSALNHVMGNPQWWTTYSVEHRNK